MSSFLRKIKDKVSTKNKEVCVPSKHLSGVNGTCEQCMKAICAKCRHMS